MSTDGYWNSTLSYTSRGDNDRTVPNLSNLPGATGFTVGSNFPRPYYEGPTSTSDSVAANPTRPAEAVKVTMVASGHGQADRASSAQEIEGR